MRELSAFPFLKLPRELRNKIYSFVLVEDTHALKPIAVEVGEAIRKYQQSAIYSHQSKIGLVDTAVLRANKQIYAEAFEVFLKKNTFLIDSECDEREKVQKHARRNSAVIRSISEFRWLNTYIKSNATLKSLLLTIYASHWNSKDFEIILALAEPLENMKRGTLHIHFIKPSRKLLGKNEKKRSRYRERQDKIFKVLKELDNGLQIKPWFSTRDKICGPCKVSNVKIG
jgi:hypothetical protein